jgi:hypothetical protein
VSLIAAIGIALDGRSRSTRLVERHDVRVSLSALWIATWLWRLRRSTAA